MPSIGITYGACANIAIAFKSELISQNLFFEIYLLIKIYIFYMLFL